MYHHKHQLQSIFMAPKRNFMPTAIPDHFLLSHSLITKLQLLFPWIGFMLCCYNFCLLYLASFIFSFSS